MEVNQGEIGFCRLSGAACCRRISCFGEGVKTVRRTKSSDLVRRIIQTAVADFGNGRCTVHKLPIAQGHLLVFHEAAIHLIRRFDNHRVVGRNFGAGITWETPSGRISRIAGTQSDLYRIRNSHRSAWNRNSFKLGLTRILHRTMTVLEAKGLNPFNFTSRKLHPVGRACYLSIDYVKYRHRKRLFPNYLTRTYPLRFHKGFQQLLITAGSPLDVEKLRVCDDTELRCVLKRVVNRPEQFGCTVEGSGANIKQYGGRNLPIWSAVFSDPPWRFRKKSFYSRRASDGDEAQSSDFRGSEVCSRPNAMPVGTNRSVRW